MANRRDVLLRIRSEGIEETKGEVRTVRDEIREFGHTEATARIDVRSAGVEAKIDKVVQRLERLSKQEATPAVRIATARATEQLDRLELKLEKLKHERVNVDVDIKRGALERTTAGLSAIDRGIKKAGQGFGDAFRGIPFVGGFIAALTDGVLGLGTAFGKVAAQGVTTLLGSFQSLGSLAAPVGQAVGSIVSLGTSIVSAVLALALLAAAAQAVLGVLVALAGVVGALVASLAAAVGGLGALAIAFGGILGPAILAVVAFMSRFTAVLKARQAQQQQVAQATQSQKAAEQQLSAALDQRKQAEQQLADATVAGRKAMAQAAQDEADAELGLRNARNGVQDARLNLALARRDLREFLQQAGASGPALNQLVKQFSNVEFNPLKGRSIFGEATGGKGINELDLRQKIQAVRDAQLGVANATNQVTHAESTLSDARKKEADFTRRGLDAYKPYVQALHQVEQANKRVAAAESQTTAAHRKYEQALKALSPTERGFLGTLDAFLKRFTDLAKVVSAPIFQGLGSAMQSLQHVFGDASVQNGLTGIGKAIGDFFAALGRQLSTDRWRTAFAQFAAGAADAIRSAGRAFRAVLEIFRVVAETALPTLLRLARRVAGALEDVASRPGRIRSIVQGLIHSFQIWASIAGHVAGIVLGFLRAAKGTGDSLAGTIRTLVTRWDRWINSRAGQVAVRRFLSDSVQKVRDLVKAMPAIISAFKHIADLVNKIADGAKWLANARKNAEHAIFHTNQATDQQIAAGTEAAAKDINLLKTHLSPDQRDAVRKRLAENLQFLQSHYANLSPNLLAILKRLKALGFQQGGLVGGSGSGDRVPAMLEPGEFVLRRAVVRQLSLPVLHAINGGSVPRVAAAPAAGAGLTIDMPVHVTTTDPDPRHYAAKLSGELGRALEREVQRLGLVPT